jgi:glycosyltransferase involved in cell wall biosynthesis
MKLLIVTQKVDENDDVLGFFHRWIEEFAKHCERVTVICLYEGQHHLPKNVKVLSLGKEYGVSRLTYFVRFYRYILSERKNYDNVFVHMNPIYVILGWKTWYLLGKKISLWYTHKQVDLKLRIAEKFAHTIFTASKESFRLKSDKVKIMGHGIDVDKFKPQGKEQKDVFSVVTVGRISPVKDYETLISAIQIIAKENIPIHVDIIGGVGTPEQKEYLSSIKSMIKEKNLGSFFSFIGSIPNKDLPQHTHRADVFVNMSHTGSLDKAVLEAMASGVVVITCNEALADVLGKDKDNLMFSKMDFEGLAKNIKFIRSMEKQRRDELAIRLRNIVVEGHNIKKFIMKIIEELK